MKRLLFILFSLALFSCAHYKDDPTKAVWSEGLWIIPLLIAIGFIVFAIRAWVAYNSGTIEGGSYETGPVRDIRGPKGEKVKPPMYKNGNFWFAVILFIAFWVVVIIVNNGR